MALLPRYRVHRPASEWQAWAQVIAKFPGADTLPRIDVIAKGTTKEWGPRDRLGWYDRERHAVMIIDDGDTFETMHTLFHELAHAWSPPERLHHGPAWQRTLIAMVAWFFRAPLEYANVIATAPAIRDAGTGPRISKAASEVLAADIALHEAIMRHRPTIKITNTDEGTDLLVDVAFREGHHVIIPAKS